MSWLNRSWGGWGMKSEWPTKRLSDCCKKIGSGSTPKGGKDVYLKIGPVRLIRSQNVHNDGFSHDGIAFISQEQAQKLSNVAIEDKDVLLNITGDSVARVCQAHSKLLPARVNQHVAIIRTKPDELDSQFLRYFLASPVQQNFMLGLASTGGTRSALTKAMIESFEIPCPSLALQKTISEILGSLDDRITLLRETNTTLEAIAQALFKSWFIDFDPVHAKMQGQAPQGMDEATAALFPDSFEESELGPIPKGWEWKSLKEAYQINPNRQLKKGQISFYLDMANVNIAGHGVRSIVQREMGSGTKFINGDTLLARITPCLENGKTAFVDFLPDATTGWGSTEFVVLRPKSPLPTYHAYLLARHASFREHAIRSMSGTSGRQRIQNDVLSQFLIAMPSENVAVEFNEIITTLQERIQKSNTQANQLTEIRNLLLPHLISGKLLTSKNLETSNT